MESYRAGHRLNRRALRHRQAGITAIGFLILATVFGAIGLAVIKIFPLYMEKMRVGRVMENIEKDLVTGGNTPESIRNALTSRFYVENLNYDTYDVETKREGQGFTVHVTKQGEAPFFADLWFVVKIDEQIELPR